MTYEFVISRSREKVLPHILDLDANYSFQYSNKEYFSEVTQKNKRIICFGYLFDIRNPQLKIEQTLTNLLEKNFHKNDVGYLNGQYVLILIKDGKILIASDATALVPIYLEEDFDEVTNIPDTVKRYKIFNPNLIFNLIDKSTERITLNLESENVNDKIISYLKEQYKYFLDKNIHLEFKSNSFMKTLISIMKPALYNNTISISESNNKDSDRIFADSISKDFNLIFNEGSNENITYLRNQLFDFENFKNKKINKNENIFKDYLFSELSEKRQITEISVLTRKRNQNRELSKKGLLHDPFNSHIIMQSLLYNDEIKKNITSIITDELLPSIHYYDFSSNTLIKEKISELLDEIDFLKTRQITAHNEQFLLDTKMSYFKVSENLDGKLKNNEILVHPATQNITPKDKYVVYYENPMEGLILVKSFFNNKKNGQTINVIIDDKNYTVDELYKGILINVEYRLKIIIQYKKARNSLPWQKAGTLLIKQK